MKLKRIYSKRPGNENRIRFNPTEHPERLHAIGIWDCMRTGTVYYIITNQRVRTIGYETYGSVRSEFWREFTV
jgi:hypothetical protein